MDIPCVYHLYTSNDIPCISLDIPCIYLLDIHGISKDIPCISTPMDIHGISMDIPRIYHVYVGRLHRYGIYHVYTRHIPKIRVPDAVLCACVLRLRNSLLCWPTRVVWALHCLESESVIDVKAGWRFACNAARLQELGRSGRENLNQQEKPSHKFSGYIILPS
jgi:hypothetical protein